MVLFKWKDDFRIGLDDIDAQQRIFMGYINQGYDAVTVNRQTGVPSDRDSYAITVDIIEVSRNTGAIS